MPRIAVILGTRPELIKCKPLFINSSIFIPIFVEQHKELVSSYFDSTCHTISITEYTSDRLHNIIMSILQSPIFNEHWDSIMVQGDTVVAYAAALAAFHKRIPVIHLEAGLRTYNNDHPWPEEGYRKMIDAIATTAFCPTDVSADNLRKEGFKGAIYIVGNTSIDAIAAYNLNPTLGNTVIVTLHRRENWDQIKDFFHVIEDLAKENPDLTFILPIHPNPTIRQYASLFKHVQVIDPVNHKDMCEMLAKCNCIISDSGGIQEEAAYLGKRVFCCRYVTERSEIADTHLTFTPTPDILLKEFKKQTMPLERSDVYGIGETSKKISSILDSSYSKV